MIVLENNDISLLDIESKTVEIAAAMLSAGPVYINLNGEGPDLTVVGLYKLLDKLSAALNFPKSSIYLVTRNLIETNSEYNIIINPPYSFINFCRQYASANQIPTKEFKLVKSFGIFVGRSNWQRLWLASTLYSSYKESTVITYHYNYLDDYHGANLGLDKLIWEVGQSIIPQVNELLHDSPILHDNIVGYPIDGHKKHVPSIDISEKYSEFFVEVVCETYVTGNTFFPTEKTWRPIMCKTPFIIQGSSNFLANLKVLGFKTFSNWWDESYDCQPGKTKIEEIIKIIDMLAKKSVTELESMYNEMLPILEHNYNVLMNLTPDQMLAANYVK